MYGSCLRKSDHFIQRPRQLLGRGIRGSGRSSKTAFTLIELLVVISIIALLMGVMLPALGSARNAAQASVCSSNIRQLLIANTSYAVNNREHYVRGANEYLPNLQRWHGKRATTSDNFDPTKSDLAEYFDTSGRVKQCPAMNNGSFDITAGFEQGSGGYGYNNVYIGSRSDILGFPDASNNSAKTVDVAKPVQTVMFTDAVFVVAGASNPVLASYSFSEPPFWQFSPGPPSTSSPDPSIHFRHNGATSVAWTDGHVDKQKLSFTKSYITHSLVTDSEAAELGVGWFGPQTNELFDLN